MLAQFTLKDALRNLLVIRHQVYPYKQAKNYMHNILSSFYIGNGYG